MPLFHIMGRSVLQIPECENPFSLLTSFFFPLPFLLSVLLLPLPRHPPPRPPRLLSLFFISLQHYLLVLFFTCYLSDHFYNSISSLLCLSEMNSEKQLLHSTCNIWEVGWLSQSCGSWCGAGAEDIPMADWCVGDPATWQFSVREFCPQRTFGNIWKILGCLNLVGRCSGL